MATPEDAAKATPLADARRSASSERDRLARISIASEDFAAADNLGQSATLSTASASTRGWGSRLLVRLGRRTLGLCCLAVTVILWTASNFLASSIFSDSTFDKPFFVVYCNSSIFAISTIPMIIRFTTKHGVSGVREAALDAWHDRRRGLVPVKTEDDARDDDPTASQGLLANAEAPSSSSDDRIPSPEPPPTHDPSTAHHPADEKLTFRETVRISLEFSGLWFLANYFASACLQYTSVGSVTILTSTSSIWTFCFATLWGVEQFQTRKLFLVLFSFVGVLLISTVDITGTADDDRGSFPTKTTLETAIGDAMAFISAVVYGLYITVMKIRAGNEEKVDMPLFFGMVGIFNLAFLWPLFFLFHFTGIETFEFPSSGAVWLIITLNSISSFFSDLSWAYAMLLTSPVIVTVGLSMTIPLSLVGEMIQYSQYSSPVYWVGAGIVLVSFIFIEKADKPESKESIELEQTPPPSQMADDGVV